MHVVCTSHPSWSSGSRNRRLLLFSVLGNLRIPPSCDAGQLRPGPVYGHVPDTSYDPNRLARCSPWGVGVIHIYFDASTPRSSLHLRFSGYQLAWLRIYTSHLYSPEPALSVAHWPPGRRLSLCYHCIARGSIYHL